MYKLLAVVAVVIGVAAGAPQARIVGGADAKLGDFKYHVFVNRGGKYACGGTILNENYILTAAHCVYDSEGKPYDPSKFEVIAGTLKPDDETAEKRKVDEVVVHKDYEHTKFTNDIALLKLKEVLKLGEKNIDKADIYDKESRVPAGSPIKIIGFGNVDKEGNGAKTLQVVELSLLSDEECSKVTELDIKGIICVKHEEGKGICNGDSGTPAIVDGELVGVASFMFGSCASSYPDGYTYVPAFKKWIEEKTKPEETPKL